MSQLIQTIGVKNFFEGCKIYFKKYAWGNTDLNEFVGCMDQQLKLVEDKNMKDFDLEMFKEAWLRIPGFNVINPVFEFDQ